MSNPDDTIVIGSGAGGGTLVHQLAPTGKRILLLERGGDWLPREPANWLAQDVFVAHQAGTCRPGDDLASSVLNSDSRAHELDNLYVVDTSFFPSIGAVNPALMAMADAIRVADHLAQRLGTELPSVEPARVP